MKTKKIKNVSLKIKIAELAAVGMMMSLTSACPLAFGQADHSGNGGDVIVCGSLVRMLDSHETEDKKPKSFPLNLGDARLSVREKVKIAISRVQKKDGIIAQKLNSRSNDLLADIEGFEQNGNLLQAITEFTKDDLVNIPDEGMATIPKGCHIEQLIVQTKVPLPGKKKFKFQLDLWAKMNADEKAAAVTHEAMYGYLISNNAGNSPVTRFYNGLMISDELDGMSEQKYLETIQELSLPKDKIQYHGLNYYLIHRDSLSPQEGIDQFDENGEIQVASPHKDDLKNDALKRVFGFVSKMKIAQDGTFLFESGNLVGLKPLNYLSGIFSLEKIDLDYSELIYEYSNIKGKVARKLAKDATKLIRNISLIKIAGNGNQVEIHGQISTIFHSMDESNEGPFIPGMGIGRNKNVIAIYDLEGSLISYQEIK